MSGQAALAGPMALNTNRAASRRRRLELLIYLGPVALFYVGFLIVPYLMVLRLSFFRFSAMKLYIAEFSFHNYAAVLSDPFYLMLMARTIGLGVLVTFITLLLGFPLALKIARSSPGMKSALIAITLSPLLINLVVRTYAWLVLLGDTGVVNHWLQAIGLIGGPLPLSGNMVSVVIGLVHISLPLMALSLIGVLERIDAALVDAADSLGASRARIMRRVIFPLALPGVGAGSLLVFSFTISAFVTPALLGGNRVSTISTLIYEKFTFSVNWPIGATLVVVLLVLNIGVVALHGRLFRED
jgi:putative spermidine/putrescine transport system permease protein